MLGLLIIGMCVSSDDEALLEGSFQSPLSIHGDIKLLSPRYWQRCGITFCYRHQPRRHQRLMFWQLPDDPDPLISTCMALVVLPHIINAGVFTSAFSAGNSFLFCSSRILYGLALRGQAPRFLTYCTKSGLPLAAVLVSVSFVSV